LQLNVEWKGPWFQENVFRCETHFHKWGRVQGMEPNGSQMHSHFGSYIRAGIMNVKLLVGKVNKRQIKPLRT